MLGHYFLSATTSVVVASVYLYVGHVVGRRRVSFEARTATNMFAVWWYALALLSFIGGVSDVLTGFEVTELAPYVAVLYLYFAPLCIALAALLFYLVFLFTGSRASLLPIFIAYGLFYVYLLGLISYYNPVGVHLQDGKIAWDFERSSSSYVGLILLILLLVPQVLGALAYASLFFHVRERTQRYRIALVSGSILTWFGSSLAASLAGVGKTFWWPYVSQMVGILAALTILAAYRPPEWVRRRLHVEPVDLVDSHSNVVVLEA